MGRHDHALAHPRDNAYLKDLSGDAFVGITIEVTELCCCLPLGRRHGALVAVSIRPLRDVVVQHLFVTILNASMWLAVTGKS